MSSSKYINWWNKFKKTGDICPIQLGQSRDEIKEVLGDPDVPDVIGGKFGKHKKPAIWNYGDLEFHFNVLENDVLFLIYMDTDDGIVEICIQELPNNR